MSVFILFFFTFHLPSLSTFPFFSLKKSDFTFLWFVIKFRCTSLFLEVFCIDVSIYVYKYHYIKSKWWEIRDFLFTYFVIHIYLSLPVFYIFVHWTLLLIYFSIISIYPRFKTCDNFHSTMNKLDLTIFNYVINITRPLLILLLIFNISNCLLFSLTLPCYLL